MGSRLSVAAAVDRASPRSMRPARSRSSATVEKARPPAPPRLRNRPPRPHVGPDDRTKTGGFPSQSLRSDAMANDRYRYEQERYRGREGGWRDEDRFDRDRRGSGY